MHKPNIRSNAAGYAFKPGGHPARHQSRLLDEIDDAWIGVIDRNGFGVHPIHPPKAESSADLPGTPPRERDLGRAGPWTLVHRGRDLRDRGFGPGRCRKQWLRSAGGALWRKRSVAEEVRTQAEDFSSASGKTTMLDVAATWDRMADNLERHLTISVRVSERECGRGLAHPRNHRWPDRPHQYCEKP